tara:strand:- start:805 stop:1173 length:369 start_codon:yes stop_codon:yes gene_type:complete
MKKISPHVQIYKFPITAVSSIATRITGFAFTGLFIGAGTLCLFEKEDKLIKKYNELSYNYKKIINYSFTIPITYHTLGGIRHFIWDKYPKLFLNNKSVARSSFLLFGATIPLTYIIEKNMSN